MYFDKTLNLSKYPLKFIFLFAQNSHFVKIEMNNQELFQQNIVSERNENRKECEWQIIF